MQSREEEKISGKRFRVPHGATILPLLSTSICDNLLSKNNLKNLGHDKGCRSNSVRLFCDPKKNVRFRLSKLFHKRWPILLTVCSFSRFFLCQTKVHAPRPHGDCIVSTAPPITKIKWLYSCIHTSFYNGAGTIAHSPRYVHIYNQSTPTSKTAVRICSYVTLFYT